MGAITRRWTLIALAGLLALLGGVGVLQRRYAYSSPTGEPALLPAQPSGAVSFTTTTISIPTYPYSHCLQSAYVGTDGQK